MGARKNKRARGRHASPPFARPFFLGPATQVIPTVNTVWEEADKKKINGHTWDSNSEPPVITDPAYPSWFLTGHRKFTKPFDKGHSVSIGSFLVAPANLHSFRPIDPSIAFATFDQEEIAKIRRRSGKERV